MKPHESDETNHFKKPWWIQSCSVASAPAGFAIEMKHFSNTMWPLHPFIHLWIDLCIQSVHPSIRPSNRRCGMNLNDTWSGHRRFFKKVCLVAAFSFLITHFYNIDCYWVYSLLRLLWVKPYKNLCIDECISKHQLIIVSTVWQILCRILTGCHWKHGQRRRMSTLTSHWAGTHTHIHTHTFGIQ